MATMQNEELLARNRSICEKHDTAEAIKNAEEAEKDNCERARTVLCTEDILAVVRNLAHEAGQYAVWDKWTKRSIAERTLYANTIIEAICSVLSNARSNGLREQIKINGCANEPN